MNQGPCVFYSLSPFSLSPFSLSLSFSPLLSSSFLSLHRSGSSALVSQIKLSNLVLKVRPAIGRIYPRSCVISRCSQCVGRLVFKENNRSCIDPYEQYRPVDTALVSSYLLREPSGCVLLIGTSTVPINVSPSFLRYIRV